MENEYNAEKVKNAVSHGGKQFISTSSIKITVIANSESLFLTYFSDLLSQQITGTIGPQL